MIEKNQIRNGNTHMGENVTIHKNTEHDSQTMYAFKEIVMCFFFLFTLQVFNNTKRSSYGLNRACCANNRFKPEHQKNRTDSNVLAVSLLRIRIS